MKKILITLIGLFSIAYGQPIGYFRYDTVKIYTTKAGGRGSLDVTGAVKLTGLLQKSAGTDSVIVRDASGFLGTVSKASIAGSGWGLTGNAGTTAGTNFFGTTDNQDGVFKANNTEQFRMLSSGGIRIPTTVDSTIGIIFKGSDRFIHNYQNPATATNLGNSWYIGRKSGNFNFTGASGGFGGRNLAIGDSTLYANTTGYRNVAIGVWNATNNTTGFENTTVGANAFQTNTTGRQNTAIGAISLENNTTGFRNTAVGFSSMQYSTTAERNVAIGGRAMQNVTTGFANAALGFDALAYNSTADHNVAVGLDALYYSNGSHNTAVGDSTLWGLFNGPGQLHVGYKNVAIGSRAGYHLGDTYNNYASIFDTAVTFLGANASRDSSIPYTTSLQNMTVIGYNARGTASNQVTIGNSSVTQHVFYGALMPNNLPGTSGQVLTSAGANANPTWTTPTSGANTALSNLASVAINTSLLPGTDNSIDVGSGSKQFRYGIYGTGIAIGAAAAPAAALDIRAADLFLTSSAVDQRFIIGESLVSATECYAISWNRTDNQLVFNEGGAAVSMRLEGDANANLFFADATNDRIGIGDATPASLFTVGSGDLFQVNTSGDLVKLKNVTYSWPAANAAGVLTNNGSGTLSWAADFALTSGNGTTANGTAVDLGGTVGSNVAIDEDGGNDNSFDIGRNTAFSDIRMGASNFTFNGGPVQMNNYGAGAATFDASGNITSVSDMRLKNLQGMYEVGLKQLMQINPIVYKWNEKSKLETKHDYIGFSAQNVKDALGENAVGVNKDGYYSLQDRAILAAMVNSIKELKELNDNQQEQIKDLKAEVKKLKKQ